MASEEHSHTNRLIHEGSPYLLQHAHNPVDWYPWGEEAFTKAQQENKLIIISIGYSSCHWCHVMERESFEDAVIAKTMNDNYVCVKVDREERPDVDQLYMDAANLMIGRGGWPLNAFALPDGRPVYAGTYFPKNQWTGLLRELAFGYKKTPEKYIEYAEKLIAGIKTLNLVEVPAEQPAFSQELLKEVYVSFLQQQDNVYGGRGRAPKFPMPDNYFFLLRYYHITKDENCLKHIQLTLDKMAMGGIYDQIGGGFARYSTDGQWKVPHFEKMLYDNAQLIGLYSEAYQLTHKPLYKHVVYQTIEFIQRELYTSEGAFYCALDADSEGEEGKFYVWTEDEFDKVISGQHQELLREYFAIGAEGYWEEGRNILVAAKEPSILAQQYGIPEEEVISIIREAEAKLLAERDKRIRPGLDDKIILSWNALMMQGLIKAHKVFGEKSFLDLAKTNLDFIFERFFINGQLYHSYKNGKTSIPAFLEDYAQLIQALIAYYQVSFDEKLLFKANELTGNVIKHFSDTNSPMFWFTSDTDTELVARKIDTTDNVIASPNSVMANNTYLLSKLLDRQDYKDKATAMLKVMIPKLSEYGPFYANWGVLQCYMTGLFHEVGITGTDACAKAMELEQVYIPNKVVFGTENNASDLPLLKDKAASGKSMIYVCEEGICHQPVATVKEALQQMQ
jgi:uncharacterized protein YyaL (SSP411 family)